MTDTGKRINALLESSFRFQKMIFYGMGIVAAVTGVILLIMTFTMPVQPGEGQIVQILKLASIVFILFGGWASWYVNRRLNAVKKLLFETPEKVAAIQPYSVSKRGIVAFAIRLHTKDTKMIGFNVVGPKTQQRLIELLKEMLPEAIIKL